LSKEQFLTCKFKIHNPSAHKKRVMDLALHEYTLGFSELLEWAFDNLETLTQEGKYRDKYNGKKIATLLPRLDCGIHSSAKDSLVQDVAGGLASYLALKEKDENTSFPMCRDPEPEAIQGALDNFVTCGPDEYDFQRNRLLTICRGSVMPLHFSRPDAASLTKHGSARNRNFSLLWRTDKRQLLSVMYLLPNNHELRKSINVEGDNLIRIDTGEVFKSRSKCAILVPLQMGNSGWQESKFLTPCIENNVRIASGLLVRDDERKEYFVVVSFALQCEERYDPEAYLGIDKGILFTAAYALVNEEGALIELGHFDDELRSLQIKHGRERERRARNGKRVTWRHYGRKSYENILHVLANQLIDMAQEHQAQILVEDISIQVKGKRVVSRFRKLDRILEYKCRLAGVPYRSVFAAYSSMICPRCGEMMNRDNRHVECNDCGYEGHSDDSAAVNIARRALYRKNDWKENGGYKAFHRSFSPNMFDCATERETVQSA